MNEKIKELLGNEDFLKELKEKISPEEILDHFKNHGADSDDENDGFSFEDIKEEAEKAIKGLFGGKEDDAK